MPQYSVDSRSIDHVIGYIKDGQISIPEIQRPFVWDGSQIRDLIDSLYRGYPVGYLIVWQNPNMKDRNGETTLGKKIMIDGQQRVTAIMTAIVGLKVMDKDFNARVYKIAFNPYAQETEKFFEVQTPIIAKDKKWIADISELFKPDFNAWTFVGEYCSANPDMNPSHLSELIQKVIAIRNSPIGIIELNKELTIDEVTEIFIRINSQGKSLTQADFVMSTIAADESFGGNKLRKAIDYFCHLATNHDFIYQIERDTDFVHSEYFEQVKWIVDYENNIFIPSFDDVLRTAFMSQYYRAKLTNLTDLLHGRNFETRSFEKEIMQDSFERLAIGVKHVMDKHTLQQFNETIKSAGFVFDRLIKGRMALDFAYTLFIRLRNDSAIDKLEVSRYVQRWYVMSIITGRYASSPETQMERDLKAINERGFTRFYEEVMANLADTFWTITLPERLHSSSSTSPAFSVYLAAQCKMNDDSFLSSGSKVRDLLESADIHHIFPRAYLKEEGFNKTIQYNQVANYVVLNKSVNIIIGAKAPCVYLKEVYDACAVGGRSKYTMINDIDSYEANCKANCIPTILKDFDASRYEEFLEQRRLLMAQKIKAYFYSL